MKKQVKAAYASLGIELKAVVIVGILVVMDPSTNIVQTFST